MVTQQLTESIESIILGQLREGEKYANEASQGKVHRPWNGRTPGKWRIGPGPQA
jgi:hypothetical protein